MNIWLALSIYLTLGTIGLLAGTLIGAAVARTAGLGSDPAWAVGAALGAIAGVWLARRVSRQWSETQ